MARVPSNVTSVCSVRRRAINPRSIACIGSVATATGAPVVAIDGRDVSRAPFDDFCRHRLEGPQRFELTVAGEEGSVVAVGPVEGFLEQVGWVLDADIRGFFDAIDHDWLMKFIEHRIADKRVLRHIKKWLNAGVLEEGAKVVVEEGVPQGGSISPLLANVYLHYVFDLWAHQWRQKQATGDIIIVRFCDDFVVGFEHQQEAEQFKAALVERFEKFNLELHADKTRLIEFGRFAEKNRECKGLGKPETFDFLGFTHICGRTRKGKYMVLRHTIGKRMRRKLMELGNEMRRRLHVPIPLVGKWLRTVLNGHFRYFSVPGNSRKLESFKYHLSQLWYKVLRRRSQRSKLNWERMERLIKRLTVSLIC